MSITEFRKKVTLFAHSLLYNSPLTEQRLEECKEMSEEDVIIIQGMNLLKNTT